MSAMNAPWVGEHEVLLHVGVHKTGTTAVQGALALARPALARAGVTYPGEGQSHYLDSLAVLGSRRGWKRGGEEIQARRWEKLVDEVRDTRGRVIVSSEALCEANVEVARRVVDDLGPERVRVVVTLRPLEQLIPSTWQQYVKAGNPVEYEPWLRDVMRGPRAKPKSVTPSFWRRNDHGAVVDRWAEVVGAERTAVVVVDTRDRTGVYRAFEELVGLPAGTLVEDTSTPSNRSLSVPEVELIRHLNERIGKDMDWHDYNRLMRQGGILRLVEERRPGPDEPKLVVPRWAVEASRSFGRTAVDSIRASGVMVMGDLDLLVPTSDLPPDEPLPAATTVPIDAASLTLVAVLERAIAASEREKRRTADAQAAAKVAAKKAKAAAKTPAPIRAPQPPRPRWRQALGRARRSMRRTAAKAKRAVDARRSTR